MAALEAASDAAIEQAVLHLPALQVDPYRGMTPHFRVSAARARALHGAISGSARIIVASAAAMLPRMSSPERMLRPRSNFELAQRSSRCNWPTCSSTAGFTREDPVDEHGAFADSRRNRRRVSSDGAEPCAWSSSATWSRRFAVSILRLNDPQGRPIRFNSSRRASDSTTASRWSRSSISCPLHRRCALARLRTGPRSTAGASNSAINCKAAIRRHKDGGTSLRCRRKRRLWIGTRSPCARRPAPRLEELAIDEAVCIRSAASRPWSSTAG